MASTLSLCTRARSALLFGVAGSLRPNKVSISDRSGENFERLIECVVVNELRYAKPYFA